MGNWIIAGLLYYHFPFRPLNLPCSYPWQHQVRFQQQGSPRIHHRRERHTDPSTEVCSVSTGRQIWKIHRKHPHPSTMWGETRSGQFFIHRVDALCRGLAHLRSPIQRLHPHLRGGATGSREPLRSLVGLTWGEKSSGRREASGAVIKPESVVLILAVGGEPLSVDPKQGLSFLWEVLPNGATNPT